MITARETIYAALFAKVTQAANFVTTSRMLVHWADVPPEGHPALFLRQVSETYSRQRGLPPRVQLSVEVYMYVHTMQQQLAPNVTPSTLLNPLLDSVEATLAPDDGSNQVQTLGGLVSHCWIEGQIEIFEGVLGDQAVAIIPVSILVPA